MAHASVASLMRTIESLLTSNSPMQSLICDHREELRALREKVSSLEVFVKNFEKNNIFGEMTDFEDEVKEVANIAEHTIQLKVTETVLGEKKSIIGIIGSRFFKGISNIWTRRKFRKSLQQLAKDIDHVWEESTKIQDKGKQVSKESLVHDFSSSTNDILKVNNNMVGRDDQKERLLEYLTITYPDEHKVIPIVGMGGIGKTTLAKEVYNNESVLRRFDVRAWATVSQQHNRQEILLGLLRSTIKTDDKVTRGEAELADMLQKSLKRKRYLIVLDDIWSCKAWDGVRRCFPTEDNAGSRILLTTRNDEVARDAGNLSMQMGVMDQDESWNLFKSAAFSNEALSSEFETIGKKIAEKCHGLPLTIVVVAGLLKSKRAIEDWGSVAKDVTSFITNDPDEQCSHVLGLSYNHLTSNLKACLLHFGIFREDSEIPAKRLMRTWMAEGFLKLENDLEGEAEKCLQELVDRCLVLVSKKSLDGTKIRSCKVHDLIYDLCLRESQRENVRSKFFSISTFIRQSKLFHFKLLNFLELRLEEIDNFPVHILSLIWLRYLSLQCHTSRNLKIPPEICRLWNLQTFIVQGSPPVTCPEEIWGLMQLRHLKLPKFYLPNPPSVYADKGSHMGFSNIQTISYLSLDCCTNEVIMGIQNVKELGISAYEIDSDRFLNNLVHLQQLETLSLTYCFSGLLPASAKAFPATLKKLKLEATYLRWSYLDIIAELPNLEVLKLMVDACCGEKWYPNVRGFTRLKVLLIEDNDVKYWKATNDNFPVLKRLVLKECTNLKEIPIEFADIHTLQLIELTMFLPELGESAARIQKEQEELGNDPVNVRISDPYVRQYDDDDEFAAAAADDDE